MDTYPTTALPADVLVLLLEKRLLADGLVATAGFLSCALISSEWHCATVEVAARHRLLRRDLVIGRKPTDAMHAGSLDGPKAVCPMAGGGVVVLAASGVAGSAEPAGSQRGLRRQGGGWEKEIERHAWVRPNDLKREREAPRRAVLDRY
jgi:hypothetical protein